MPFKEVRKHENAGMFEYRDKHKKDQHVQKQQVEAAVTLHPAVMQKKFILFPLTVENIK